MEVDPRTGGRLKEVVFDLNGDGLFNINDMVKNEDGDDVEAVEIPPSGKRSEEGIIQPPSIVRSTAGDGTTFKYSSGSKGGIDITVESPGIPPGRKSWVRLK
jgi:type IV pilus assembly protein PilY1